MLSASISDSARPLLFFLFFFFARSFHLWIYVNTCNKWPGKPFPWDLALQILNTNQMLYKIPNVKLQHLSTGGEGVGV